MIRRALLAMLLAPALLLGARSANAGPNDILIGLDAKVTYGPDGPVNGESGKDEVLVMDVSNPAKPVIRARLALMNSLLGPPTNLQITPDGRLGLVASSVLNTPDAVGFTVSPDDRLFVIDLTATPPGLVDTVTVGKQPSGLAIARSGDLALVANRYGKSISVLSIAGGKVSVAGEIPVEQEASAVAIAPDGKRAFICMNVANRVGVLTIDGRKVSYDKAMDIPVAFNPYNLDITPNGKFVIVSTTGAGKNNGDTMAVIDATGPHPHTVAVMTPGTGPEGFAISSDGKWVAAALIGGSGAKQTDWFRTKGGELALMSLDSNSGEMTVKSRAPLGGLPEGLAFSPKNDYIYVGNYFDSDLRVFHIVGGKLKQAGPNIKLGGQPASMRALPH
jgi:DNA-binding beta-propeller fold protein YncE